MEQISKALIIFWIKQVNDYARNEGMKIDPLPKIDIVDGS